MYTVKQLSDLAGVSVRTLHHYDAIGLLKPTHVGANGYRYYDDGAVLRLQQVLLYREMGLELARIRDVLNRPDFDLLAALDAHRDALQQKIDHLHDLIGAVDATIGHLKGETNVSKKKLFEPFSEEKQKYYERVARLEYGPELVNESARRWGGYTQRQRDDILEEAGQVYTELADALTAGLPPQSAEVQALLARWHQNLRHFYEPTLEVLQGLGELYTTHPEFMAFFQRIHAGLAEYLREGIVKYVDDLETAELERMERESPPDSSRLAE